MILFLLYLVKNCMDRVSVITGSPDVLSVKLSFLNNRAEYMYVKL